MKTYTSYVIEWKQKPRTGRAEWFLADGLFLSARAATARAKQYKGKAKFRILRRTVTYEIVASK
jgi:hypothetical protein